MCSLTAAAPPSMCSVTQHSPRSVGDPWLCCDPAGNSCLGRAWDKSSLFVVKLSSIPAPSKSEPGRGMVEQIAGAVSHPAASQAPGLRHRLPVLMHWGTPENAAAAPIKSQRRDVPKISCPCRALGPVLVARCGSSMQSGRDGSRSSPKAWGCGE